MEWVPRGVWNGWAGSVEHDCGFVSLIYSNHSLYYSNIRKSILVGNLTHRDIERTTSINQNVFRYLTFYNSCKNHNKIRIL